MDHFTAYATPPVQLPTAFASTLHALEIPPVGNILRQKKAGVLANVRHLIAKEGWEKFSLRKLADQCQMSRQTLHNIAGGRLEIAVEAVCDHASMLHNVTAKNQKGRNYFFALTENLIEVVRVTPEYSHEIIKL